MWRLPYQSCIHELNRQLPPRKVCQSRMRQTRESAVPASSYFSHRAGARHSDGENAGRSPGQPVIFPAGPIQKLVCMAVSR